jgi:hypothetical protein
LLPPTPQEESGDLARQLILSNDVRRFPAIGAYIRTEAAAIYFPFIP